MKLIIDINEEQYKFIKQNMTFDAVKNYPALLYDIWEHIANGTPLPKGHGDLIDRDDLLVNSYRIDDSATMSTRDVVNVEDVEDASTIIEADGDEE